MFADLELDDETHEVRRAGTPIDLTATEFRLLRYLIQNAPRVLSKAQILDHVWHYDFGGDANIVETYVSYLRRKVDGIGPPLIQTVRGVGYRLTAPRELPGGRDGMTLRVRLTVALVVLVDAGAAGLRCGDVYRAALLPGRSASISNCSRRHARSCSP